MRRAIIALHDEPSGPRRFDRGALRPLFGLLSRDLGRSIDCGELCSKLFHLRFPCAGHRRCRLQELWNRTHRVGQRDQAVATAFIQRARDRNGISPTLRSARAAAWLRPHSAVWFLANQCRAARLRLARRLLRRIPSADHAPSTSPGWCCPRCGAPMILDPILSAHQLARVSFGFDTS